MAHSHHHHSHHHHSHSDSTSGFRLLITIILNFIITIVEIIGGIVSGSLSLISDALHNFSDGIAIIISYFAIKINQKPKNSRYTFGYKRAEIIAAVFNASVLIGISIYLFIESYDRFMHPNVVHGKIMTIVAFIGLMANIAGTLLLKAGSKESINIRSSYLHLLSDAVSSAGVIIGGLFIYFYNISWIDPVLTILISIYIIRESYFIVKEAVDVLMLKAPHEPSIEDIASQIEQVNSIDNIHHIHLWQLNEKDTHFEAHVEVNDMPVSRTEEILEKIEEILYHKFEINHVTIQFECNRCANKNLI